MRFSYDREEDILTIEMTSEGTVDHAEHTGPFIAHFSDDGQLLLLEILDASEFLASLIKATLRSQEQELPLVVG
jgi:uncharacterized protein YuzE